MSPSLITNLERTPVQEIPIERLGLNKITTRGLAQQGIKTIGALLQHSQDVVRKDEIGKQLLRYLEWLIKQDESIWSDEINCKGICPLLRLGLAKTTCEALMIQWFECLSNEREKQVLSWRYGMEGATLTLQEIGDRLEITRERVRQIEKQALRKLTNRYRKAKQDFLNPILSYLQQFFEEQGGLFSEAEADGLVEESNSFHLGNIDLKGFLMLVCEVDRRFQYFKRHKLFALAHHSIGEISKVQAKFSDLIKEKVTSISQETLLAEFKQATTDDETETWDDDFLLACLRVHPNIEHLESGYIHGRSSIKRLGAIVRALREIGQPAHYSVITKKANSHLPPEERFTERALHAKLGQHPDTFVWVRLRGTYGLKEWGLEQGLSYVDAIEKIFLEAGKPLTFEQVIARLPAHREHFDEGSVIITLGTHEKFKSISNNTYGLSSWNNKADGLDFGDMFGEQLAQRQAELDRNTNDVEIDTQSEVDKIRRIGIDFFAP